MTNRLKGKRAVVTGAGRGIGREIARMMVAEGAAVLAVDITAEPLLELQTITPGLTAHPTDLTDEAAVAQLAQAAAGIFDGALDILVNAAGICRFAPLPEMTLPDFQLTLRGEVETAFLASRALWPLLVASGRASVVNFASANAHTALLGLPAIAHTAGKGAVLAMTRQIAMEGGPHGIRANTIAPGFTVTEETAQHLDTPLMAQVRAKCMVDRLGTTTDIGHLAIYLASDESLYVTGADLRIDGGATAW
ncbi:SDR family oxidoreductase [Pseudooceanicola sp. CBS1P-1]|uniref:SDR family oxidoreductase n=1 Tax=Pseudooceanicola albus TaxID=2692189 RepID=A0A6L7GAA3_9RHOB|nr:MULTISPECIES: SDR family oxidoreductase [Pseudooceanicola]MBT9386791.1 SDR family oxidoreductase [Pseudooceanicola endophyticus]MXN20951.1 SDR family oxidoreductase [Pseudooceanicola albus]